MFESGYYFVHRKFKIPSQSDIALGQGDSEMIVIVQIVLENAIEKLKSSNDFKISFQ